MLNYVPLSIPRAMQRTKMTISCTRSAARENSDSEVTPQRERTQRCGMALSTDWARLDSKRDAEVSPFALAALESDLILNRAAHFSPLCRRSSPNSASAVLPSRFARSRSVTRLLSRFLLAALQNRKLIQPAFGRPLFSPAACRCSGGWCSKRILFSLLLAVSLSLSGCSSVLPGLFSSRLLEDENITTFSAKDEEPRSIPTEAVEPGESREGPSDGVQGLSNEALRRIPLHQGAINDIVVAPDGNSVYTSGEDGNVYHVTLGAIRDQRAKELTVRKIVSTKKPILGLALSPNGKGLAIALTSAVYVVNLEDGTLRHRFTRVKGRITAIEWDPRGELILFGTASGEVYAWSLREGWFEGQGADSFNALENYSGGTSPIASVALHPSGGAFFSAETDGVVSLWRLLRTEKEIGLRDTFAIDDQETKTTNRKSFASLRTRILTLWLNWDGSTLYAPVIDGSIYAWKVRGLVQLETLKIPGEEPYALTGMRSSATPESLDVIVTSGRRQRLLVLCAPRELRGEIVGSEAVGGPKLKLVGQSEILPNPISILRSAANSPYVWAVEKSGELYVFDSRKLLADAAGIFNVCLG